MNTEATRQIEVRLEDGRRVRCETGTPVGRLAPAGEGPDGLAWLGAIVNNEVVSFRYPLDIDCEVRFITVSDPQGFRIYRRSLSFLLAKVLRDLYPSARFAVEHSLGKGFYCSFEQNGQRGISPDQVAAVETALRELVARNAPIDRFRLGYTAALEHFQQEQQPDKVSLLRFSQASKVVLYGCEGFSDLAHGPLAPASGAVPGFSLIPLAPGFVLQFPERDNPRVIPPFEPQPQLFHIFQEHKEWGRILGVTTVGRLNEIIASREIGDFIKIAEALHEKKIARIADRIHAARGTVKWVFVAGPSSSGKTTFAKRLAVQLRVNGLRPVTVSVDNYFIDRAHTPRDENGEYDFENIESLDLALFHDHLRRLDAGEEVEIPHFNFDAGVRELRGDRRRLGEDEIAIVEGIHGLNPRLPEGLPPAHVLRIYVSALTQINLDTHNRVSTTDNRLLRRLVRDQKFRGHDALTTLKMWPSVRRGEKRWIFPFQHHADIAFNSALDYEMGVLKSFVEPILAEVKPSHPQYTEARRLTDFLASFLRIPAELVPPTSILREFIGRSSFQY